MSTAGPFQDDGLYSLDYSVRDYDLLERMNKQGGWTDEQQRYFEAGWEAAVIYYRDWFLMHPAKEETK